MDIPKITCAVCGAPVAKTVVDYDFQRMATRIAVKCHGETDECWITDQDIAEWGQPVVEQMLSSGVAFDHRKLGAVRTLLLEAV